MTASFTLPLPDPYGRLTVLETIDDTTGAVRYLVSARRMSGVFVFRPYVEHDTVIPTRVAVDYGDGFHGGYQAVGEIDRPTVNGVELIGGTIIDPERPTPLRRRDINVHRPTGRLTSRPVPDRTGDAVAAVLEVLRIRWHTHPRRDELVLTAARRTAARRRDVVHRDDLNPRYAQRDRLAADIAKYEQLADDLHRLATSEDSPTDT